MAQHVSAATLARVRDYAVAEPSFTCAFAAWDLSRTGKSITSTSVKGAVERLIELDVVELIEDAGRAGKVYAYKPIEAQSPRSRRRTPLPELDASIGVGAQAQQPGVVVPHTRARGESSTPGATRKRQKAGQRIKRARTGT